jgi:hypothetical protein
MRASLRARVGLPLLLPLLPLGSLLSLALTDNLVEANTANIDSDAELARKLQEEEDCLAACQLTVDYIKMVCLPSLSRFNNTDSSTRRCPPSLLPIL